MKKKVLSFVLTAIMSLSILPGRQALGAAEKIQGWTTTVSGTGECNVTEVSPCFDKRSLSLTNQTANDSVSAYTQISVKAGENYKFSFWARSDKAATATAVAGNAKFNLASRGNTYYWTYMEYIFTASENSPNYKIGFELSKGGKLFIDGISVINTKQISKNLVTNGGFELVPDANANKFLSGMSLSIEEELAAFGDKNVMPMLYMDNFELDANLNEWAGYASASMPNANTDMTGMKNYGGENDLFSEFMLSYDETNFYIAAKVVDDVFDNPNTDSNYWKGDSIQLAIGTVEEDFGVEIGLYQNNEGTVGVYSSELIKDAWGTLDEKTVYLRENSKVAVQRVGNVTYYEAQLPWLFRFDGVPEECLINVLVNDSDGSGRKGFFELQPGIGFTKSNEKFVFGTPIEHTGDVFGYIDGPKWLYQGEAGNYSLYIANSSEKEESVLVTFPDATNMTVKVPAKKIYKYDYVTASDEVGMHSDTVTLQYQDKTLMVKKNIQIKRDLVKAFLYVEETLLPELKDLEAKCLEKGLNPVYEHSDISTITNFIAYGREDLNASRDSRAEYVYNELVEMYDRVKKDLTAYLDGSKEPFTTYLYKGDEMVLEDMHYLTKMQNTKTGEMEERPTYFVGYNVGEGNSQQEETYQKLEAIGANLIQLDIPMQQYISVPGKTIRGWGTFFNGGVDAAATYDSQEVQSGDYSLKITNNTPTKANTYFALSRNINLQKDKTYVLSFWIKANNASGVVFRPNGWGAGSMRLDGTYDWKKVTYEYKPTVDETKELLWIVENTTSIYLDNVRLVERGTNENLIEHGSFEDMPVIINDYVFNEDRINGFVKRLDMAHKHNIQVDVIVGVHYFPNIIPDWQLPKVIGWPGENINNPEVLKIIEAFITGVVKAVKDHPALHSICLMNEPKYSTGRNAEIFSADWIAYIRGLYQNDITVLNAFYGTEYTSFEEVPLTDENINEVMYYDYIRFNAKVFGGWHEWMAGIVKRIAPEIKVHKKFRRLFKE